MATPEPGTEEGDDGDGRGSSEPSAYLTLDGCFFVELDEDVGQTEGHESIDCGGFLHLGGGAKELTRHEHVVDEEGVSDRSQRRSTSARLREAGPSLIATRSQRREEGLNGNVDGSRGG